MKNFYPLNSFVIETEQTAISFLRKKFKSAPVSLIYKLFRTRKIIVGNENLRYYQHRLKAGSLLEIVDHEFLRQWKDKGFSPVKKILPPLLKSEIIYEDQNILIVIKEHDVEMNSQSEKEKTLDNEIAYYLSNSGELPTDPLFVVSSVHRLDKLTKGIVVYPKNSESKKILHNSFGKKELIRKQYLALCENSRAKKIPNLVEGFIYKDDPQEKMVFRLENQEKQKVKSCSMNLEEICSRPPFSLFEVTLGSGRKHQIRATLQHFGSPIIGDKKYGSSVLIGEKIKLFAYKISFLNLPHPLDYLNGKTFEMKRLKDKLVLQLNSSSGSTLPKKILKY